MDGDRDVNGGEELISEMHSFKRSCRQKIDAASGSNAIISCLGLSAEISPP